MKRRAIFVLGALVILGGVGLAGWRLLGSGGEVPTTWAEYQTLDREERTALTADQLRAIFADRDASTEAEGAEPADGAASSSVCDELGPMSPECQTYLDLLRSKKLAEGPCRDSSTSPQCLAYLRSPERGEQRGDFR